MCLNIYFSEKWRHGWGIGRSVCGVYGEILLASVICLFVYY